MAGPRLVDRQIGLRSAQIFSGGPRMPRVRSATPDSDLPLVPGRWQRRPLPWLWLLPQLRGTGRGEGFYDRTDMDHP